MGRPTRIAAVVLAGWLGGFALLPAARAGRLGHDQDLDVHVETDWPTNLSGGYFPFRILIRNDAGQPKRVTAVLTGEEDHSVARVVRSVEVAAHSTSRFPLLWPVVDRANGIELTFQSDGRALKVAPATVQLASESTPGSNHPSVLLIGPRPAEPLRQGLIDHWANPSPYSGHTSGPTEGVVRIEEAWLPDTWLAYSGLGAVLIDHEALMKLDAAVRTALLDWASAGGTLLVAGAPAGTADEQLVRDLAGLPANAAVALEMPLDKGESSRRQGNLSGTRVSAAKFGLGRIVLLRPDVRKLAATAGDFAGPELNPPSPEDGAIITYSGAAGSGGANSVGATIGRIIDEYGHGFEERMGYSAAMDPASARRWKEDSDGNASYLSGFVIPGVGEPPVRAFVVVMLLFSIVVGPVNFIFLYRRKRQHWMVVTVPAAALVAVLAVVLYAFLFEGLSIKGRVTTVSWLDGDRGRAVTVTRQALYAGWSPGTVRFEPHTGVFPISPGQARSRRIDWTGGQELSGAWVPSRTEVQWVVQSVEPARQRIEVSRGDGGTLVLSNGLGVKIERVFIQMPDGGIHEASSIADGARSALQHRPSATSATQWRQTTASQLALVGRVELAPGRFIATTSGPLFERGGPEDIDQLQASHVIAGTFRVVE